MSKQAKKSLAAVFLKDLVILVPFFLLSFFMVRHSVPSYDPFWINFWAIVTAFMMSSVAWIALQMFKAVLFDQIARTKAADSRR